MKPKLKYVLTLALCAGLFLLPTKVCAQSKKEQKKPQTEQQATIASVKGVVTSSDDHLPVIGAYVTVVGTKNTTATDLDGKFELRNVPANAKLHVSFVGMQAQEVNLAKRKKDLQNMMIVLEASNSEMDEVVVTGIYNRKKESFTGSSQTYTIKELKSVGNMNLIQSLKTLDPAFALIENNDFGSDPNKLPDIEIRGKSSIVGLKEQFGEDPNQPLFILDGFETTLQTIMDLSMDRIASVTILKDAASTAIYGAKAANGVVVVETHAPEAGKLKLSYNGSFNISWADLSDYNLMNAKEKLEFERLSGNFESNLADYQEFREMRYNKLLAEVERGVDTYWMSEPVRTGLNQRHSLYAEGGNEQFRYGLGGSYNSIEGVMKNSSRDIITGNLDLLYRVGKLTFSNKLSVDVTNSSNPVVPFSEYAKANPYYRKRNSDGSVEKWLERPEGNNNVQDASVYAGNPLYNASLTSYDRANSFGVRDNFNLEYRPFQFLYVRGRVGLYKGVSKNEDFTSPDDTSFESADKLKKGSYATSRSETFNWDADFTVTYGQLLGEKHQVNAVLGASLRESDGVSDGYAAIGFPEGNFTTPAFATQYTEGGKPSYSESTSRSCNFYFNGGYSFMNRYLLDANLRADGTSVFGSNRKFTTTWAVGLAWNIHNEEFMKRWTKGLFTMFKIRGSVGNPGNQNFGSFNTITTYKYNNWMLNNFGTGLIVNTFGNPDLNWQKTLNLTLGIDLSIRDRFHLTFDIYRKNTDPLLANIGVASSVGVTNRLANIGKQVTSGYDGTVRYSIIYRPKDRINWTTSLSVRHTEAYYDKIGETLAQYNNENIAKNLTRYYDGGSPTALWAVRSAGIDPATGREIFITKEGRYTFTHSYEDEVKVGDTNPVVEGVFGNTFYWKGFSCSAYIRYSCGAKAFNRTVYNKVENISVAGLTSNQDRRALYDRWQKPGDVAQFKGISITETTPMSSRFVQDNNYIVLESIRVGWEVPYKFTRHLGIQGMTLSGYMNDICRIASIEAERGISYPFARSVSLALSINF